MGAGVPTRTCASACTLNDQAGGGRAGHRAPPPGVTDEGPVNWASLPVGDGTRTRTHAPGCSPQRGGRKPLTLERASKAQGISIVCVEGPHTNTARWASLPLTQFSLNPEEGRSGVAPGRSGTESWSTLGGGWHCYAWGMCGAGDIATVAPNQAHPCHGIQMERRP